MSTARKSWIFGIMLVSFGLALLAAPQAQAFFPPPPTGVAGGEVPPVPPPPPPNIPDPPSDPFTPPPNEPPATPPPCSCACISVHTTPEPATLVSGLVGLSLLGGYVVRRRLKK